MDGKDSYCFGLSTVDDSIRGTDQLTNIRVIAFWYDTTRVRILDKLPDCIVETFDNQASVCVRVFGDIVSNACKVFYCLQSPENFHLVHNFINTLTYNLHKTSRSFTLVEILTGAAIMPRKSPYTIELSPAEEQELRHRTRQYTLPYFAVQRAQMILLAAEGWENKDIAAYLHTRREVVWLWRKRFFEHGLAGLEELPRPGRPPAFPPRSGGGRKGDGV